MPFGTKGRSVSGPSQLGGLRSQQCNCQFSLVVRATELAAGLLGLGVRPEERVAIAGATRLEWVLADLAVALAEAATTTVYPSTNAEDVEYILGDCGAVVVFAEDSDQLAKVRPADGFVRAVRHVVLFDGPDEEVEVLSWDQLGPTV